MHFPVYLHILGLRIHPHPFFEGLGYFLGFQLYLFLRRREKRLGRESLSTEDSLRLVLGAAIGAFVGSKVLGIIENVPLLLSSRLPVASWLAPKTIVGGLLGGWAGIEIAKKILGVRRRMGDLVLFPIMLGMAVGRIGCFLTGLDDGTCGTPSRLPWAVNFGDGIPRHPTQLYDIVFLGLLGIALWFSRGATPRASFGRLVKHGGQGPPAKRNSRPRLPSFPPRLLRLSLRRRVYQADA
jgi:phosphatidylglycerol:prolipoprotein diacylglycerol transferase